MTVASVSKFKDNITKEHREAIRLLKEKIDNKEIIITKADKGSGIVALYYELYIIKGTKYIEEEAKAYELVNKPQKQIVKDLVKARNHIVTKLKEAEIIQLETATYCSKQLEEKVTGMKFYFKIHKDSNIVSMPLRPLQSCIHAPTHHLSQVLTDLLQPFLKTRYIPTFISNSNQLLYRLSQLPSLDTQSTLISSDVAALYPSIPHKEGLLAINNFLEENSMYSYKQIKIIIKALELVITDKYVMWNGKIYKQTSGVAMGTLSI